MANNWTEINGVALHKLTETMPTIKKNIVWPASVQFKSKVQVKCNGKVIQGVSEGFVLHISV